MDEQVNQATELQKVLPLASVSPLAATSLYSFGKTEFTDSVNIAGGQGFKNIGFVVLETNGTAKSMTVFVYNTSTGERTSVKLSGGWLGDVAVHLTYLPRGYSYSVNLTNTDTGTVKLIGGSVGYDYN